MITVTPASLGIDLHQAQGYGLYKWLLASFLVGKRIRSTVAVEAYRKLIDLGGLDTPAKLAACSHRELVRLLGLAGYARYDESTARRLHALGSGLASQMSRYLDSTHEIDVNQVRTWLLGFEGVGPKTVEIFLRELSAREG